MQRGMISTQMPHHLVSDGRQLMGEANWKLLEQHGLLTAQITFGQLSTSQHKNASSVTRNSRQAPEGQMFH